MANSAPHLNPFWTDKDTTNSNGVTAQAARYGHGALSQPAPGSGFSWAPGVFPGDANVATITDYQATQATPSANMTVLVQSGQAQVHRTLGGPYIGTSTAPFSVTIGAANTNPRIDYVVMRFRDLGIDGVGSSAQTYQPVVLPGTPSGSPSEPVASLTDGDVLIAAVTVRANTLSILNSDISDRRLFDTARGGIYPMSAADTRNGAYPGHVRYNMNTKAYEGWDGTAWQVIASPTVWSSWTAPLKYNGAAGIGAGNVALGSGGTVVGRYLQQGKRLEIAYTFTWGSSGFSGGAGPINTTLPPGMISRNLGETHIPCLWYSGSVTKSVWAGLAYIGPNTNGISPRFPISQGNASIWELAVQGYGGVNGAGTGTPNIAGAFSDGPAAVLSIMGTIEIQ